jgi:hypothetical protein
MHQINRGLIKADRRLVDRQTADLEQLALARQAQIGGLFTDHLVAFPLSSILRIDCRAAGGLIASALVIKNHFPPQADQSWREAL